MINLKNIVRPNIWNMESYSSARDEYTGTDGVFLDANENPYGTLNRYPDPYQNLLKNKLAQVKDVQSQNIFIGNGSDEAIDLAFRIFCRPGLDTALTFTPTYGMYDVSAAINDIRLIKTPLSEDFQIDLEKTKAHLQDPNLKIVFICSPNNPTGNLIGKREIEDILSSFNGIVIIDEAYIDFSTKSSLIKWIDRFKNLIVCQTFSKARGLAGARVGIAYACTEIIALMNKVKPPYNVSSLNQQVALECLTRQVEFDEILESILVERDRLESKLRELKIVEKVYPSDANFLLIKVANADNTYQSLIEQNIVIRNRNKQVPNCLRISIGTHEENNQLLNALKNIK